MTKLIGTDFVHSRPNGYDLWGSTLQIMIRLGNLEDRDRRTNNAGVWLVGLTVRYCLLFRIRDQRAVVPPSGFPQGCQLTHGK